jgi:hypothetical protein
MGRRSTERVMSLPADCSWAAAHGPLGVAGLRLVWVGLLLLILVS